MCHGTAARNVAREQPGPYQKAAAGGLCVVSVITGSYYSLAGRVKNNETGHIKRH